MGWTKFLKAALVVVVLIAFFGTAIQIDLARFETWMRERGALGPVLFGLAMIIGIVISPIPTSPLTLISAKLFGVWGGMALSLVSATLGAFVAFYIARCLRDRFLSRYPDFVRWQRLLPQDATAMAVFLLRLPPSPAFDAVSYLSGLTRISPYHFGLATFLGMIPVTFTLCFFGAVLPSAWFWPLMAALALWGLLRLKRRKSVHLLKQT